MSKTTKKENKKGISMVSIMVVIVAMCVLSLSSIKMISAQEDYERAEVEYEEVINSTTLVVPQKIKTSKEKKATTEKESFQVDFKTLEKMNEDVIGWIRFDEPSIINYPVVQGKDNNEYLSKTFKGYENTVGSIFADMRNSSDFSDRHTIIYGHRMNNGTMFNELDKFKDEEFGKAHPYFFIYTPDGENKYQIYSTEIVPETSDIYEKCKFPFVEEYKSFLEKTKANALYDTGVEVTTDDKVITLSTCTGLNKDERLVVHAVLVEE